MTLFKSLVFRIFLLFLTAFRPAFSQTVTLLKKFEVKEAKQAVAVDAVHFYVINNSTISKHTKADGKQVGSWDGTKEGIVHLNSGVVINGKLYCANSNYPEIPMTSSVEIFDVKTLTHVDTHSFGIAQHGSLTWLDQKDGHWFIGFAHYAGKEASEGRDVRWTSLVKYDLEWRQVEAWVFPKNLIDLFTPKSNSGGAWGTDGQLYCTGHDRAEVYVLKLPASGYTLQHVATLPASIEGQGIAIDKSDKSRQMLYGINRSTHTITVSAIK